MRKKHDLEISELDLDAIFSGGDEITESRIPKILQIPLDMIDEFPDHPFQVRLDEDMDQLVESIKERGVITPVTLRKKEDGRYETVSGHRRVKACELAGLDTVPAEIKTLTRDEAIILMVDSNLQRSTILPSEKAKSYTAVPVFANTEITYETGEIEVDNTDGQVTTYKAFRIFNANKNEDGTMSNFSWPNNSIRNAVIGVIQQFTPSYASYNAQDAADYISAAYQDAKGEMTTDQTTILESQELLNKISAAVDDVAGYTALSAGKTTVLSEGYWLVVTDGNSVGTDEDGTSPIFAIVSGGAVKIVEKTSVPTVDKVVLNDADGADWTYGAEAERGQSVEHKITGTVAKNIKTYDLYYYEFEDVMSKGIDYDMGSYKVMIDDVDVTSYPAEDLLLRGLQLHPLDREQADVQMGKAYEVPG